MELMEGLTLLSEEVQSVNVAGCYIALVLVAIGLMLSVFASISLFKIDLWQLGILFLCFVVVFFILGYICIDKLNTQPATVYKVTIDESVSMVEFYERYEILNQEGLIFTIAEKEK